MPHHHNLIDGSEMSGRLNDDAIVIDVERVDDDDDDDLDQVSIEDDDRLSNDSRQPSSSLTDQQGKTNKGSSRPSKTNRNPTCALCKNHRYSNALRGHKRYCSFARCPCDLCAVTRKKQKVNAAQVATRRAVQQDKELGIDRSSHPASSLSGSSTPRTFGSSPLPTEAKQIQKRPIRPSVIASLPSSLPGSSSSSAHHPMPPSSEPPPAPPPLPLATAGPELLSENIGMGCWLLKRDTSLLANSFHGSHLNGQQLIGLEGDVCKTLSVVRGEISGSLKDLATYLENRLQREQHQPLKPIPAQLHRYHPAIPIPPGCFESMAAHHHHHNHQQHIHHHHHKTSLSSVGAFPMYTAYASLAYAQFGSQ